MIVCCTVMVNVLFSTLTGCRGRNANEEAARWIPVSRDSISDSDIQIEDSLDLASCMDVVEKVAVPVTPKKKTAKKTQRRYTEPQTCTEYTNTNVRSWSDEFGLDSIELTITVADVEIQITQNLH